MKRTQLVAARARKSWTLEQAAERIGCAPNTLSRWELGTMAPSSYNRARLCAVYEMTAEELGLEEEVIRVTDLPAFTGDLRVFLNADFTMRLLALVFTPHGNPLRLQAVLSRTIEESTMDIGLEAALTRREALRRLAMLPVLFGISAGTQRPLEETINQCAAGIIACEYLSKGAHEDIELAYSMLSAYLPTLKSIVKESSLYRKEAATLVAQSSLLKTILGWHKESLDRAMQYGNEALLYSEEASNLPLQIAIHTQLSWIFYYARQSKRALTEGESAAYLLIHPDRPLPPNVYSSVYSALAIWQAMHGQQQPAITSLRLAHEYFFKAPATGSQSTYIDFEQPSFFLEIGMAHTYLRSPQAALDSFARIIDPNDLSSRMPIAERVRIEILNNQVLAFLKSPSKDMEQAVRFWITAIEGAKNLQSEQRYSEALLAYAIMEGVWPNEARITELRDLIVHW